MGQMLTKEIQSGQMKLTLHSLDGKTWVLHPEQLKPLEEQPPSIGTMVAPALEHEDLVEEPKPKAQPKKNYNRLLQWGRSLQGIVECPPKPTTRFSFDPQWDGYHTGQLVLAAIEFGLEPKKLAEITGFPLEWVQDKLANAHKSNIFSPDDKWLVDESWDSTDGQKVQFVLWILAFHGIVARLNRSSTT